MCLCECVPMCVENGRLERMSRHGDKVRIGNARMRKERFEGQNSNSGFVL